MKDAGVGGLHPSRRRFLRGAVGLAALSATVGAAPLALAAPEPRRKPQERKRVLFLTHPGVGTGHASLPAAERMAIEYGGTGGFDVTVHEGYRTAGNHDFSFLTMEYLSSFDALMLMTNGDLPWSDEQRRGIVEFVRGGKGFIGVHCAALTMYEYPEFGEMLGGYYVRFITPARDLARGRVHSLKVEDGTHPSTKMLGDSWPISEELYNYAWVPWNEEDRTHNVSDPGGFRPPIGFSRERVNVLLSLDTERTNLEGLYRVHKGGDYPQAWYREYGEGRSFYTSLGHREETWTQNDVFRAHLTGGIRWTLGLED